MCLTYPEIGNVGANADDEESARPFIEALVVREFSALASNWRSTESVQIYLSRHNIPVIWGLDTRALVRHLRSAGAMRGIVATDGTPAEKLVAEARALPKMAGLELASGVSCSDAYDWARGSIELTASPWHEGVEPDRTVEETQRFRVYTATLSRRGRRRIGLRFDGPQGSVTIEFSLVTFWQLTETFHEQSIAKQD